MSGSERVLLLRADVAREQTRSLPLAVPFALMAGLTRAPYLSDT